MYYEESDGSFPLILEFLSTAKRFRSIKNIPKEYTDKYAIKKKELEGKHSKKQDQNVVKLPNTEISDVTKPSHPVNTPDVTKPSHPVNTLDVTKPSHPDVTKPSHKENKINNNVVVVMKTPSKIQEENPVNGNAFDDPSNKIQYTINKIERVTGIKISKSYAQEITSKYTMEKIDIALDDMEQQLKNGMVFKVGVGSWLQAYLIRGYVPDQIPENQKSPHKTRTSYTSINKVRNNHKTSSNYLTQQKLKKKEFIKTLYT